MPATTPACPRCERPLARSRRSAAERHLRGYRRWRCAAEGCSWAGLLPKPLAALAAAQACGPTPPGAAREQGLGRAWGLRRVVRRLVRRAPRFLPLAVGLLLTGAAAAWLLRPGPPPVVMVGPHVVHRGTHLDGERLPPAHPLNALLPAGTMEDGPQGYTVADGPPLRVRRHCAWGLPGRHPYRGSPEQALRTATLSPTVVRQIAADIRAGRRVDRVQIDNDGIRAKRSGREFDPARVAMTYGMTLCVDTRINFTPGHREGGDLFEAMDDDGRMYAVMVPDVCGNVSVLGQRYVRAGAAPTPDSSAAAADPRPWLRLHPDERPRELPLGLRYADRASPGDDQAPGGAGRPVSTPGTLTLSGLALTALWLVRQRRRRAQPVARPDIPGIALLDFHAPSASE